MEFVLIRRKKFCEQSVCALLSRSEIRDLVDVRELENADSKLKTRFPSRKKDTGLTAAQLAWVLNQIKFGDDLIPQGNVSIIELRRLFGRFDFEIKSSGFSSIIKAFRAGAVVIENGEHKGKQGDGQIFETRNLCKYLRKWSKVKL
ncbi:MAG: hypothetical protein WKF58_14485 [Ilumatobacteraceae bacterium]